MTRRVGRDHHRTNRNTEAKAPPRIKTPAIRKRRSPRLVLPGCIALNPTSCLARFGEPIVPAELLLRQPPEVLLHRRGDGPGLRLGSAGPLEHGAAGII